MIKPFFTFILSLIIFQSVDAQWKYSNAKKINTEIIINYEIIYDKEPTENQKNASTFSNDIVVIFNSDKLKYQKFYKDININSYSILDYNKTKIYTCRVSKRSKTAIVSDFGTPKRIVEIQPNEFRTIAGFQCDKGLTKIKGIPKEIYYTKKLGLRYCKNFNLDGFVLEYPGYDKKLGYYRVVAKSIHYKKLDPSIFSVEGFRTYTKEEYDASRKESVERYANARIDNIGKTANKFNMWSLDGKKLSSKAMKNEVVVLNFWFTTCPPCKAEIPKLNTLREKYKDQKVNFIAVALDPDYRLDDFLSKKPFNFDIVPEGRWMADKFNISSYPTNIVIDKKGVIKLFEIGYKYDIVERISYQIDKALKH